MATKNPRLTFTLTPTLAAQFRRLSELTGQSQAGIISELLEGNEVVFAKLIKMLEAAKSAKGDMVAQFSSDLQTAQGQMERQLGLTLDAIEVSSQSLLVDAEKVKRRKGKTPSEASPVPIPTPLSNRGVRSAQKQGKKGVANGPL